MWLVGVEEGVAGGVGPWVVAWQTVGVEVGEGRACSPWVEGDGSLSVDEGVERRAWEVEGGDECLGEVGEGVCEGAAGLRRCRQ